MPEPILVSIAAALAGKAATGLYDLAKRKFSGHKEATAELEAAVAQPDDPQRIEILAERLAASEHADPEFGTALRAEWANHSSGNVHNQVQGSVAKLVQARDIHGNITL
jgi:hypothetical protein